MKKNVWILVLVMIGIMVLIILGCNSRGINFWGNSGIVGGFVPAIGKVSNTFGTPLSRDIDGDTDNDSAVVLNNIAGGSGYDYGYSIAIDGSGKVYITGESLNASSNSDAYVIIE